MFVFKLVLLAVLAASTGQAGIPRYIQGKWIIPDDELPYEEIDRQSQGVEESLWPSTPSKVLMAEEQNVPTTPDPHVFKEQDKELEESVVWKIVLVAAVLLVSVVGCLSMAYYLCVWRGGRIHYQPQKQEYS